MSICAASWLLVQAAGSETPRGRGEAAGVDVGLGAGFDAVGFGVVGFGVGELLVVAWALEAVLVEVGDAVADIVLEEDLDGVVTCWPGAPEAAQPVATTARAETMLIVEYPVFMAATLRSPVGPCAGRRQRRATYAWCGRNQQRLEGIDRVGRK